MHVFFLRISALGILGLFLISCIALIRDYTVIPFAGVAVNLASARSIGMLLNQQKTINTMFMVFFSSIVNSLAADMLFKEHPEALCGNFTWDQDHLFSSNYTIHHGPIDGNICPTITTLYFIFIWILSGTMFINLLYVSSQFTWLYCTQQKHIPYSLNLSDPLYIILSLFATIVSIRKQYQPLLPLGLLLLPAMGSDKYPLGSIPWVLVSMVYTTHPYLRLLEGILFFNILYKSLYPSITKKDEQETN